MSVAFESGDDRIPLAVQSFENSGHQHRQFRILVVFQMFGVVGNRGLRLFQRRAPLGSACDKRRQIRVASPILHGIERRPAPDARERNRADFDLTAGPVALIASARRLRPRTSEA